MIFGLRDRRLTTWPPRLRYNLGSASLHRGVLSARSPRRRRRGRERAWPHGARAAPPPRRGRRAGLLRTLAAARPGAPPAPRVRVWPRRPPRPEECLKLGSKQDSGERLRAAGSNPSFSRDLGRRVSEPQFPRWGAAEERGQFWLLDRSRPSAALRGAGARQGLLNECVS